MSDEQNNNLDGLEKTENLLAQNTKQLLGVLIMVYTKHFFL